MGIFKRFLLFSCTLLAVTAFFSQAHAAFSVTPESDFLIDTGTQTSTSQIVSYLQANWGLTTELYKQDVEDEDGNLNPPDSGTYALSYSTTFSLDPNDPSAATITWGGGSYIGELGENPYLLVKDGKADPAWYLFDLGLGGWDGQAELQLTIFWPGKGAISHVSIFDGPEPGTPQVPLPSSAYLLGSALLLLPAVLRRKQKRN